MRSSQHTVIFSLLPTMAIFSCLAHTSRRLYLVYPYIEHGSLADLLTLEKPWETWELPHITDVITQSAEGLFHLHKSGIVHQNVRPNTLVWMPTDP